MPDLGNSAALGSLYSSAQKYKFKVCEYFHLSQERKAALCEERGWIVWQMLQLLCGKAKRKENIFHFGDDIFKFHILIIRHFLTVFALFHF